MMKPKGIYDGKALMPEEPVALPPGTLCESTGSIPRSVDVQDHEVSPALEALREFVATVKLSPDFPTDAAAQHDHYLYGTPKRIDP